MRTDTDSERSSLDNDLTDALLAFVRDEEARLDVRVAELGRDASALPLVEPDRGTQLGGLMLEAAYLTGQRDSLDLLMETIGRVAGVPTPVSETPDEAAI